MKTAKAVGGSLGAVAILIISQTLASLISAGLSALKLPEAVCRIIAGALYLLFAYLLLRLFALKVLKVSLESVGMPRFHIGAKWIVTAFALPLAVKGIFLLLPGEFVSSHMDKTQMLSTLCGGVVLTGIAAGFVEEMVFRGFVLNLLKARWNKPAAIVIPSVLFGFVHILGMGFSPLSILLVLLAGTSAGIMFSLIELESSSVWNSGVVHAVWNIIIIGGGLTVSETVNEQSIMTYVLQTKSFAVTGGEFGIEASVIALAAYAAVSVLAVYMAKRKNAGKPEEAE